MRAILVSVDYSDLLSLTLPYNKHHFEAVLVVTSSADHASQEVAKANGVGVFITDSFYKDGAVLNKFRALEEGLDAFGRHGWLCLMDADVLWPKDLHAEEVGGPLFIARKDGACGRMFQPGMLLTPRRRMDVEWHREDGLPSEDRWTDYLLHPQQREFAGYSQIFHASDPVLGPAPWHEVDWVHAGGADSFFQAKWPDERKVRPPFEVLHLGPAGVNWYGRASAYCDGSLHRDHVVRQTLARSLWAERRRREAAGLDRFGAERLKKTPE